MCCAVSLQPPLAEPAHCLSVAQEEELTAWQQLQEAEHAATELDWEQPAEAAGAPASVAAGGAACRPIAAGSADPPGPALS